MPEKMPYTRRVEKSDILRAATGITLLGLAAGISIALNHMRPKAGEYRAPRYTEGDWLAQHAEGSYFPPHQKLPF